MEEKILIKGEKNTNQILFAFVPSVVLFVIGLILMELATVVFSQSHRYDVAWELCGNLSVFLFVLSAGALAVGAVFAFGWSRSEFTVTNQRVCGIAAFGKRVDLPLDSVSAVGTSFLNGIDVGTSSGRLRFKFMKNNAEIHTALSKLIVERQKNNNQATVQRNVASNADEVKKFKELLDSGIITQEEFDKKKKQLLGL